MILAANGQALWYLTRASGAVALILLTASVLLGVMNSTRWRSVRLPRFVVFGLHRNVTLLAIAFVVVHVVTTVTDAFAPIGLVDAVVPFLSPYRPIWLGLGTVAFDLLLALTITSLLRRRIGARAWRLVHWLAYASWPVAMLHTLGTGSDARSGWLAALSVTCGLTVAAAVAWRVAAARDALPLVRAGAVLGAIGVAAGLFAWAKGGPLETGWAARAGTPATLLGHRRTALTAAQVSAAASVTPDSAPSLPARLDASLRGTLSETPTADGLVVVRIDLRARGRFHGRVHLALRGQAVDGGGVAMIDSVVGLLPDRAPAWSQGQVVGLRGQRVLASIQPAGGGQKRDVLLDLHIDPPSHVVTGVLRNAPSNGERAE